MKQSDGQRLKNKKPKNKKLTTNKPTVKKKRLGTPDATPAFEPAVFPQAATEETSQERALPVGDGSVSAAVYFARPPAPEIPVVVRRVAHRALGLFVVRESDEWNKVMFDAMRDRTYLPHRSVPEVEAIRNVGLAPLKSDSFFVTAPSSGGDAAPVLVLVEVIQKGRTKAALFFYGGYWHLWCQASAAKVNDETRTNDFTEILVEVIERVQPETVYAANVSRLVRSMRHVAALSAAMTEYVDELHVGEFRFEFNGPNAQVSVMMLNMLSWCAAMERDAIVTRLLAGRIAKWRRNEWCFGDNTVPFGYMLDENKALVPDLSKKDAVREMLLILASDLPPAEMIRQLEVAGVTSMRKHRRLKVRTPISALSSKDYAIRALLTWAPVWVSGEYLWRHHNCFGGLDEIVGVPIVRHIVDGQTDVNDMGELQMLYRIPIPDDGWAEPEVLAAFSAKARQYSADLLSRGRTPNRPIAHAAALESRDPALLAGVLASLAASGGDHAGENRRAAARARKTIAALTGRGWTDGDHYYELQASASSRLRLVRWRKSEESHVGGDVETQRGLE